MALDKERLPERLIAPQAGAKETGINISSVFFSRIYKLALSEAQKGLFEPNRKGPYFDNLRRLIDGRFVLDNGVGYVTPINEIQEMADKRVVDGKVVTTILIARETQAGTTFKIVKRYSELLSDGSAGSVLKEEAQRYYIGQEARIRAMELASSYIKDKQPHLH